MLTMSTEPYKDILGIVIPMIEKATMSPHCFITVYLSEPYQGTHVYLAAAGRVKSVSKPYVKEKL